MAADCPTMAPVCPEDMASWDRADPWLARIAALLEETADECSGEPAGGMWVMREGRLITGCVGIRRRRANGRLELCRLHVRPECRGRGLSKQLIQHALTHARARSGEAVTAQVREDNVPALRALTSFGFCEISRATRQSDGATILLLEERRARAEA